MKLPALRLTSFAVAACALIAVAACSSTNSSSTATVGDAGNDGSLASNTDGGNGSGGDSAGDDSSACDAITLAPPASSAGIQLQIPLTLGAGQEREVCQLVKVDQDMDLNSAVGIRSDGSHHALVYSTPYNGSIPTTALDGETLDGTQVHTCTTPSALWSLKAVVAGAKTVSDTSDTNFPALPPNVAFKVKAGDYVLLNFHLLNPSNESINSCYKVNLNSVPDSQVNTEAGTLFWYNPFITVPASGTSTARMACPITKNITLEAAVSHAHQRLSNYTATLLSGDPEQGGTTMQTLYQGTAWDSPVPMKYPTPIAITAGQWIDYHCDYANPAPVNVAQGLQTTDEMCMFIGPYWPRDPDLDYCADANGSASLAGRNYGFGTKSGADFLGCYWTTPQPAGLSGGPATSAARYAAYSCVTETCPKASGPITPYLDCLANNSSACQTQCTNLQGSLQAVCAETPETTSPGPDGGAVSNGDGCQAEYGTDGTDGTCAASAGTQAAGLCTTDAQTAELTTECEQTLCSQYCDADAGGQTGVACTTCLGSFTGDQKNGSCLNQLTLACVAAQAKTLASTCVTNCFTGCITKRVTQCTVDCLNNTMCPTQYAAVAAATCN